MLLVDFFCLAYIVLLISKAIFICHLFCVHSFVFCSRCTCVAWVPEGDGAFVVGHADGNLYVYEKVGLEVIIQFNLIVIAFKFVLKLKSTLVLFV